MIKLTFGSGSLISGVPVTVRDEDGTFICGFGVPVAVATALATMEEEARQHRADGLAKAAGLYGDKLKSVFDELMSSGNVVVQIIPAEQFRAAAERAEDERDNLQRLNDQLAAEAPPLHMRPDIPKVRLEDASDETLAAIKEQMPVDAYVAEFERRGERKSELPMTVRERVEEIMRAHGFDPRLFTVPLHDVPAPEDKPENTAAAVQDAAAAQDKQAQKPLVTMHDKRKRLLDDIDKLFFDGAISGPLNAILRRVIHLHNEEQYRAFTAADNVKAKIAQDRDKLKDTVVKAALDVVSSTTQTPQRARAMGELRRVLEPFYPHNRPDY